MGNTQYSAKQKKDATIAGAVLTSVGAAGIITSGVLYDYYTNHFSNTPFFKALQNNKLVYSDGNTYSYSIFIQLVIENNFDFDVNALNAAITISDIAFTNGDHTLADKAYSNLSSVNKSEFTDILFFVFPEFKLSPKTYSKTINGTTYTLTYGNENTNSDREKQNLINLSNIYDQLVYTNQAAFLGNYNDIFFLGGIGLSSLPFLTGLPTLIVGLTAKEN